MTEKPATEQPSQTGREIIAIELRDEANPGSGSSHVAEIVAAAVQQAFQELADRQEGGSEPGSSRMQTMLTAATATSIGAIEGTLRSKSLEGALREAQILEAYAEARHKNEMAAHLEALAEETRVATALRRLKETIEMMRTLGVDVNMTKLPDGRLGIALGNDLVTAPPVTQDS